MQCVLTGSVEPVKDILQRLSSAERVRFLVRRELRHVLNAQSANEIERLQRAHTGGTHGNDMTEVSLYIRYRLSRHRDNLGVHNVLVGILSLDRLECAGTDMQRQFCRFNAPATQVIQHSVCEVQSGSRCCHRTLDTGIDGLIGCLVRLLSLAVEVWRNRQFTKLIKYLCKG